MPPQRSTENIRRLLCADNDPYTFVVRRSLTSYRIGFELEQLCAQSIPIAINFQLISRTVD